MNKKRLIAYLLALTTLTGCSKIKKSDDISNNNQDNYTYVNSYDNMDSSSPSMKYEEEYFFSKPTCDNLGSFYMVADDTYFYDAKGNILDVIEKYEKVLVFDNCYDKNGYVYIQKSNGTRGFIDSKYIYLLSSETIYADENYHFNSFNEIDLKNNNNSSLQPNVYKFVKEDTILFNENNEEICALRKYDIVNMINKDYNIAYVSLEDGTKGYVYDGFLERLPESFVEVDISNQKLYAFYENQLVLTADVVTGNPTVGTTPGTNLGYTEVNGTLYDAKLMGNAPSKIFISFNSDGEGFHDACWRSNFGGKIYLSNGSHGCVNMNYDDVKILDEYAKYGTKVLVHK